MNYWDFAVFSSVEEDALIMLHFEYLNLLTRTDVAI